MRRRNERSTWIVTVGLLCTVALAGCGSSGSGDSGEDTGTSAGPCPTVLSDRATVRFGYNPSSTGNFALGLALQRGYYDEAGLDVEVTAFVGAANPHIPLLAKGDLDVIAAGASSSLLNARAGGFDVKLFLPITADEAGYASTFAIMARPTLVDSGRLNPLCQSRVRHPPSAGWLQGA